jgi:hypothetical protein
MIHILDLYVVLRFNRCMRIRFCSKLCVAIFFLLVTSSIFTMRQYKKLLKKGTPQNLFSKTCLTFIVSEVIHVPLAKCRSIKPTFLTHFFLKFRIGSEDSLPGYNVEPPVTSRTGSSTVDD